MTSPPDFDYLCDLLVCAGSLSRDDAFIELREASLQLEPDSPLRFWFLGEMAQLLGLRVSAPRADARAEVPA